MKTLAQYEKELKERAIKTHDLAMEADHVSIETALMMVQEAAEQAIDRCAEVHKQLTEAANENKSEAEIYSAMKGFVKHELK